MFRRVSSLVISVIVVVLGVLANSVISLAQDATPQATDAEQLFTAEGIDAPILAQADLGDVDISGGMLVLERIEIPANAQLAPRTTLAPELLYVETGTLALQDDFGFATLVMVGNEISINAGTTYTIGNQGVEPVELLRLRLADDAATAGATPSDLTATPMATPVAAGVEPTVLISVPVEMFASDAIMIFLASATFAAGTETGEQGDAGPIGLYVEDGSLQVVSPSGIEGTVSAGQGVGLPAETPLQASADDGEATALIVGVVESTVAELQDFGTPIVEHVGGIDPADCWSADARVAHGEADDNIALFPQWDIPPEMVIDEDESYQAVVSTNKGKMIFNLNSEAAPETVNNFICLAVNDYYDVTPFHRVIAGFIVQGGDPTGTGSGGPGFQTEDELPCDDLNYTRGTLAMANAGPDTQGSQFFIVHEDSTDNLQKLYTIFGHLVEGEDVLDDIADSAVVPNQSGESSRPVEFLVIFDVTIEVGASPTAVSDVENPLATALTEAGLQNLLPGTSMMPQGLDDVDDVTRTEADVVTTLGGSRDAATRLENWGWSGNFERVFTPSDPDALGPEATTNISVSLHGFMSEQAAADALPYYSDILVRIGYEELDVGDIGTSNRLMIQVMENGGTMVVLYIQEGTVLYRIGGYSETGDPTNDVADVARQMLVP